MTASSAAKRTDQSAEKKLGTTQLLFQSAQEMGLHPSWITTDGLFAVTFKGRERYINFARSPLNSHISVSLARNKYLTRSVLARHEVPNIPFTRPDSQADASAFLLRYGKIVAKPVIGSGAHDVHIVTTSRQLLALNITKYILEEYIAGQELRYLILNGNVIGVHRSDYGVSVQTDRELQRISYASDAWSPALVSSAIHVAQILDLNFAAVDYLITSSGNIYLLEVNTSPGLKWFHAPTSGPIVDVARQFLEAAFKE